MPGVMPTAASWSAGHAGRIGSVALLQAADTHCHDTADSTETSNYCCLLTLPAVPVRAAGSWLDVQVLCKRSM
jgi:hypothetical protein